MCINREQLADKLVLVLKLFAGLVSFRYIRFFPKADVTAPAFSPRTAAALSVSTQLSRFTPLSSLRGIYHLFQFYKQRVFSHQVMAEPIFRKRLVRSARPRLECSAPAVDWLRHQLRSRPG